MIKKIILFTSLLFINPTFCQHQEAVIRGRYQLPMKRINDTSEANNSTETFIVEDTGFYWVLVKTMPSWWTFWRRWKPVRIMAEYAKTSTREIWRTIESEMPLLMPFTLKEVQSLKAELLPLGCEIEIHEIAFSFSSPEDAEYFKRKLAEKYKKA